MKVALTGGTGFLGQHLTRHLIEAGHEVTHIARKSSARPALGNLIKVDFDDVNDVKSALVGNDAVVHAIGVVNGSLEDIEYGNVTITETLIKALPPSVKRFVYVSSAAAAMQKGPYGEAKLRAEALVRMADVNWVIFRPTLIYGPGDTKNLAMMINWVRRSPLVPVLGGGGFKVQPVHVDDVCQALVAGLTVTPTGSIYNICGPEQVSLLNMLKELKRRSKSFCLFVPIPLGPVKFLLRCWARVFPNTKLPVKQVQDLDKHEAFDWSATQAKLNFNPRRFQDGLDWM